jgi:hypothetical protein
MTTYYYGIVEFGRFEINGDDYPLAIVRRVDQVKEFDTPAEAWEFYSTSGSDSYVGTDATDEDDNTYEIVFHTRSA